MSNRYDLAAAVTSAITEGTRGTPSEWCRNPYQVPGAVADWCRKMPGVAMVDDGESERGRGTTAFDLVRRVETGGLVRFDWLSIKTATIQKDKKLPSKLTLSTGTPAVHDAIIRAYTNGTPLATLIYASEKDAEHGRFILADLAAPIRTFGVVPIEQYPEGGYARGCAPPIYFKWSSPRPSGVKRAENLIKMGVPDDGSARLINGCLWTLSSVQYPELVVSLHAIHVGRESWLTANRADLPFMLDHPEYGMDWENL